MHGFYVCWVLSSELTRNKVIYLFFSTCFVNIRVCWPKDLNLIVTARPHKTLSASQHLEFISRIDKHKYSHNILPKPPNTSYTPCCQRLGGLSPWDWLWGEITFLPADCKNGYVTTQHHMEVWGKEEKIEIRFPTAPLPASISVDISECFISCQNAVWKRATDTDLGCGRQIWILSCALGAVWEVPTQTRIDPDILCKACAPFTHKSPNKSKTVR